MVTQLHSTQDTMDTKLQYSTVELLQVISVELWVGLTLVTLQDSQPIRSTRRHVTFTDHMSSCDSDHSDKESSSLIRKHHTTKKLPLTTTSSDSDDDKPYDSCDKLSARTKHTAHTVKSADDRHSDDHHSDNHHSDDHHSNDSNSSPSQFLDCEAEEVWQSDEGSGSDDLQDFIVDDAIGEWGSCDASEVDNDSIQVAQSVSPKKRCHGRKLLDSSSESVEEMNGNSVAYIMYWCGLYCIPVWLIKSTGVAYIVYQCGLYCIPVWLIKSTGVAYIAYQCGL